MPDGLTQSVELLRNALVTLYPLGVGSGSDYDELQNMATHPVYGHFFKLKDYDQLQHFSKSFAHMVCASKFCFFIHLL